LLVADADSRGRDFCLTRRGRRKAEVNSRRRDSSLAAWHEQSVGHPFLEMPDHGWPLSQTAGDYFDKAFTVVHLQGEILSCG
jgi:hypothetical protein